MLIVSWIATYALSGLLGFRFGRKLRVEPSPRLIISLALLVVVSQWVLVGTRVIDIFGFQMYANWILQGFSLSMLIGLLTRKAKQTSAPPLAVS